MSTHLSVSEFVHAFQGDGLLSTQAKSHLEACDQCREELHLQIQIANRLTTLSQEHAPAELDERVMAQLTIPHVKSGWFQANRGKIALVGLALVNVWVGLSSANRLDDFNFGLIQNLTSHWGQALMKFLYEFSNVLSRNLLSRELLLGIIFIIFYLLLDLIVQHRKKARLF